MKHFKYQLLLIFGAFIWGSAFVAQSKGADVLPTFTFNTLRSVISVIAMTLLLPLLDKVRHIDKTKKKYDNKQLLLGGFLCGVILAIAMYLQQFGLAYTTVGKAGFLSALYVIFVPLVGILLGRKVNLQVWIAVIIAMIGLYFLSLSEAESFAVGDLYVIACAIVYTFHILVVDYFAPRVDPIRLSLVQFATVALVCVIPMIWIEKPNIEDIKLAWIPLLYTGIISGGMGYTIQVVSQSKIESHIASIIMSLESVFAALSGYLLLHEVMSIREVLGAILVFVALLLAQIKQKEKSS